MSNNQIQVSINKELFESEDAELRAGFLSLNSIKLLKNLQADVMAELANRQLESNDDVISFARFQGDCQGQLKVISHLLELHLAAKAYITQTPQTEGE